MLRISDIVQELEKQLAHLNEQAEVAKHYRDLEAKRELSQRLLWLVNKQEAESRRVRLLQQVEKTRNELEAENAKLREVESTLESARSEHFALADALHAKQGDLYTTNAEVSRLEQQIAFLNEQRNRMAQQIVNGERQIEQQRTQLQGLQSLLEHWQHQRQEASVRVEICENHADTETQRMPKVEEDARAAQDNHNAVQRAHLLAQQQLQLAETQRGHIQNNLQQLGGRKSRLLLELDNLPKPNNEALQQAQQQIVEVQAEYDAHQKTLLQLQEQLPLADNEQRNLRVTAQELERQLSQIEARLSALDQLQSQLDNDKNLKEWLTQHKLDSAPRLWKSVRMEQGWDDALEAVLRERLNALALAHLDETANWKEPPPAKLAVFSTDAGDGMESHAHSGLTPLASYVSCEDKNVAQVIRDWLTGVYAVADLAQALAQRAILPSGAWLVTSQGHMVGTRSVLFHAPDSQLHGVLARQREIENLHEKAQHQAAALEQGKQQVAQAEEAYRTVESSIGPLRAAANVLQQRQHAMQMQILKLTQANERSHERHMQIEQELQELAEHVSGEQRQLEEIAERMLVLRENMTSHQAEAEQARQHAFAQENLLREQRERSQKSQHELQEARFFSKTCADKISDLDHNIKHSVSTLTQLELALVHTRHELVNLSDSANQQQLQAALDLRQVREQALAEARNVLEHATLNLNKLEQERMQCEQKLNPLREKVQEITLKEQEARLHFEQWAEQLQGVDEVPLQAELEKHPVKPSSLQAELNRLSDNITSLGAVNLAALDELKVAEERKAYLDAQAKDLNEAIHTLEGAIRRIDKESRDLLMGTYEEVNRHLAELFPVLFGGGEARLVLTGEEILDSGVQVMAHPPGKKNASIHLLSGGEKALTAIALVFSLFQLNPAPFCLLDEVDAPLDDTNTERLCNLIKKMAVNTQFVFISHNKITMELAQQLIGVTMQERGVSKVVSVDIEEALRMRDESVAA
jgi:chromosome segregation protein